MAKKAIAGEIELGDLVRDRITGFEGVVVAVTHWITGCARISIQPQSLNKEGQPTELATIDITQLELLEKEAFEVVDRSEKGGPRPGPEGGR